MIDPLLEPIIRLNVFEPDPETGLTPGTPAERIGMMWQLVENAMPFMSDEERLAAQSPMRRDLLRVFRRTKSGDIEIIR